MSSTFEQIANLFKARINLFTNNEVVNINNGNNDS